MESKAFDALYKSLTYNKNNNGPKIHPKIDMYVTEVWHKLKNPEENHKGLQNVNGPLFIKLFYKYNIVM